MTQCRLPARHTPEDPQNRPVRKKMSPTLLCYCYLLLLLCVHILTLSLNGKTYQTKSFVSGVSASTEDVFGKCYLGGLLRPFPPTGLHVNNRHLRHLEIHRPVAFFHQSPSSHLTLKIVFQFRRPFWNLDWLDSLTQSNVLHQLHTQKKRSEKVLLFLTRYDKLSTYFEQHDVIALFYFSKIWMFAFPDIVSHGLRDPLDVVGAENNSQIPEWSLRKLSWRACVTKWLSEAEEM